MRRLLLGFAIALASGLAGAQGFPTKTVTVSQVLDSPEYKERVEKQLASEILPASERGPDAFRALLEKDAARVSALVKSIGLKPSE